MATAAAAKKVRMLPKLFFGSDHGGFSMKAELMKYVSGKGEYEVVDLGTKATSGEGKPKRVRAGEENGRETYT